ncbi:MAG: polyphosphate kinase, partial [Coleofasciculus sp. S288]|nr:polyphosphate kinase [Coleofasciculus sp. S288]
MPKAKKADSTINLNDPQYYFNPELSWLEFNRRVLHEAMDSRTPLLERVKFAAIFSSNLDEFFMIRVASLKQQVEAEVTTLTPDGRTPEQQLDEISKQLHAMVTQLQECFETELLPQLATEGIYILNYADIEREQHLYLQRYFEERIFPILTPLAVDPAHPFPRMSNLSLNLAVVIKDPETGQEYFARVKVPNSLSRFISLPPALHPKRDRSTVWVGVPLEQIIAHNLEALFPGMHIQEHHLFRITRDADLEVQEDEADDLVLVLEQELRKRHFAGCVVRLQIPPSISDFVRQTLVRGMKLEERDVYEIQEWLGLRDLMSLTALELPHLKDAPWTPVIPPRLRRLNENLSPEEGEDIFSVIRQGDLLVHHPYESFSASVECFITHAAH